MRWLMHDEERALSGGNLTGVVRIGTTVRRALGPWSPTVHHLLRHLEEVRFDGAPRFRGIDDRNREILTYLGGDVGFFPYIWLDESLIRAAQLLRRFHDATAQYQAPNDAAWQFVYPDATRHEVICHNDFAPYNLVFVAERPSAMIDFDTAGPGPRIWDIAYAVYWFVPLYPHDLPYARGLNDLTQANRRMQLFCTAYGIRYTPELLDTVERRLDALCTHLSTRAAQVERVYQKMVEEGHLAGYQQAIRTLRQHRAALEQYLV
jgi:Ser/Thr protein kinase RdoA (MazF antagonist)